MNVNCIIESIVSLSKVTLNLKFSKAGPAGFNQSFGKWLDSTDYRNMIATGKGKLEWERKIPEEHINDLKVLLEADNFDENLPAVSIISIQHINQ